MFEGMSDADLIEVMGEATREEATAIAQRLAAVAELYERRVGPLAECEWWCTDYCDAVAAEISPVQNISHARAVKQVQLACDLSLRLPRVAKLFARGVIDFRVVLMIIARTENVDDGLMPALDEAIARRAEKWMKLSIPKLRDRVDFFVADFDPAAVRVPPTVDNNRYVDVEPLDTAPGTALVSAQLHAEDGVALTQRLDALAATVCENDPRTKQQRRADACGSLARGEATLACKCGSDDCPAAVMRNAAEAAVIHVLAEQGTLDGSSNRPGYLVGFGVLPAESVRNVAKNAKCKPVTVPADVSVDSGYRPTAKNLEFLRWRDLTCRWPGCDKPAQKSDVDHTVPYPDGPTHPSNTKHYCRTHHLIKTFFVGVGGWSDRQLPDGTIELTAPTGHVYRSEAHGASLFSALGQSTGALGLSPPTIDPDIDRSVMMPRRKRTRAQNRRDRIDAERQQRIELNAELAAEQHRQREAWLAANYQPPPF